MKRLFAVQHLHFSRSNWQLHIRTELDEVLYRQSMRRWNSYTVNGTSSNLISAVIIIHHT